MSEQDNQNKLGHWHDTIRLLLSLLAVWFIASFGAGILFAEALNSFEFFGFKLGFWFAQQGSIYVFLILILVYIRAMKKLDEKYGMTDQGE